LLVHFSPSKSAETRIDKLGVKTYLAQQSPPGKDNIPTLLLLKKEKIIGGGSY